MIVKKDVTVFIPRERERERVFIPSWDSQTIAPLSNMKQLTVRPSANYRETLNMTGKSWTPVGPEGILVPKRVLVWDQNITVTLLQYFLSSIFVGSIMLNHQTYQKAL